MFHNEDEPRNFLGNTVHAVDQPIMDQLARFRVEALFKVYDAVIQQIA